MKKVPRADKNKKTYLKNLFRKLMKQACKINDIAIFLITLQMVPCANVHQKIRFYDHLLKIIDQNLKCFAQNLYSKHESLLIKT